MGSIVVETVHSLNHGAGKDCVTRGPPVHGDCSGRVKWETCPRFVIDSPLSVTGVLFRLPSVRPARWRAAAYSTTVAPCDLHGGRPRTARLELPQGAPIDLKPAPWQRLLAIGSILSVVVLAIGLYITNAANRDQQEANRAQQRLTAQGQITDRYTKAVEQLGQPGPEKIDVRLGAIYALERIMRDSATDHGRALEDQSRFLGQNPDLADKATRCSRWSLRDRSGLREQDERRCGDQRARHGARHDLSGGVIAQLNPRPADEGHDEERDDQGRAENDNQYAR